jgi:hypothetical protein
MVKPMVLLFVLLVISGTGNTQGMKIGDVLIVSHPNMNSNANPEAFQAFVTKEMLPVLNKQGHGVAYHLFKADRGKQKGQFLLAGAAEKINDPRGNFVKSPFNVISSPNGGKSLDDFVTNAGTFTEYHLIGGEKIKSLPNAGILGIHSIQVKKERSKAFEKFVVDKLHPAVSQLFPDMQLLFYKAVAGENTGSYITIFTINSPAARDKYWPGGTAETEILKKTFKPLEGLAKELGGYLVEGSYLEPSSGGAAAYWESKVWTDFVDVDHLQ